MAVSALLSTITIDGLTLRNRVVMAPMTRRPSGSERVPNRLMADYYARRSSAGMIVTQVTAVSLESDGRVSLSGVDSEQIAAGWQLVADTVHASGGVIFLQLGLTGQSSHPIPQALSAADICRMIEVFSRAALRAKHLGFDGLEVNAASGGLLDAFLRSSTNRRTDAFGGSLDNRFRFLGQLMDAVLTVWPAARLGVRLSPNRPLDFGASTDSQETFLGAAERLDGRVVGYLHVVNEANGSPTLAEFRRVFRGRLVGNGFYTKETAEAAVETGEADLIAFDRSFISNPDLIARFADGRPLLPPPPESEWYSVLTEGKADFPTHD